MCLSVTGYISPSSFHLLFSASRLESRLRCCRTSQAQSNGSNWTVFGLNFILHLFDRLEVFDSFDSKLKRGILAIMSPYQDKLKLSKIIKNNSLANDQSPGMCLQSTSSDHVVHPTFDHLTQCQALVLTSNHKYNLFSIHDCLNANSQSHTGYQGEVIVEKTAVVKDGLVGKSLDSCSGSKR